MTLNPQNRGVSGFFAICGGGADFKSELDIDKPRQTANSNC